MKPSRLDNPPCATWKLWTGVEIEGVESVGKGIRTLFIRSLADYPSLTVDADLSVLRKLSKCQRVWFCKEFENWALLLKIAETFDEACVEVEPKRYTSVPLEIRKRFRIFLKVDVDLKPTDVVCIGKAFNDESFVIGTGAKVTPNDYANDKRIN